MILIQPLSLYEFLSLINYTVVFIALIVSLYFVMRQTREMASQTKSVATSLEVNTYHSITEHLFTLDEIFISHPELRPYFYSGKESNEDDPNHEKVLALAEFVLDLFGTVVYQMPGWPRPLWEAYIKGFFTNSPILCKYLHSTSSWYPNELTTLMKAAELQKSR